MPNIVNSKLIKIFKTFSLSELKDIDLFLNSPFFNVKNHTISLFNYLRSLENLNEASLNREIMMQFIFNNKEDQESIFRKTMSELLKLFYDYLFYTNIASKPILRELSVSKELRIRKLNNQYLSSIKRIKKLVEEAKGSEHFFYYNYKLNEEHYNYLSTQKREPSILNELNNSLNDYLLFSKLSLATITENERTLFNAEINDTLYENLLLYLKENPTDNFVVNLYQKLYYLVSENLESAYYEVKELLIEGKPLSSSIKKQVLLLLINFCVKGINNQKQQFLEEVFFWYSYGLEEQILLVENKLSPYTYRNISVAAIKLKKFIWVRKFIEEYKNKLLSLDPESYYSHCLARLFFAEKKFDVTLDFINKSSINDIYMDLSLKVIQLKVFYELGEIDVALNMNESFRKSIARRKLLAYHKNNFKNFNSTFSSLLKLNKHDKTKISQLHQKIQAMPVLLEKDWFLEKL